MQCGKHVGKNLPVFTCMENPYDVSTSKVYTERITEYQNKLQKREWEGFCISNVKYLSISKTIKNCWNKYFKISHLSCEF